MNLHALTNNAKIIGYVALSVFMRTKKGKVLELEEEAYVVPGMQVPILLGEDFQKNYNVSIHRYEEGVHLSIPVGTEMHEVHAFNEPHVDKGFEIYRVKSLRDRQRAAVVSEIQRTRRDACLAGLPSEELDGKESHEYVRAAEDVWIAPDASKKVRLAGDFSGKEVWLVERLTINTKKGFYGTGTSLLRSEDPFLHIANISATRQQIRRGDVLGILRDPDKYLDQNTPEQEAQRKAFALLVQKLAKGSAPEKEALGKPLKSPNQPGDDPPGVDEDEVGGPKTAEVPVSETLPSSKLEELIDISPDAPEEIRFKTFELIHRHIDAFGFDDRIGKFPVKARIRTQEDVHPVSLPMYGASPAKREVIDAQMDKWIAQEIIEPSSSPWGAPVVIVYRNNKPCFCVDYRKLNTLTIPDEFPLQPML